MIGSDIVARAQAALLRSGRPLALTVGLAAFAGLRAWPAPAGFTPEAWAVVAVAALMAVWWMSEAMPLAVTALLPALLFPLTGVAGAAEATAPYAHPLVFLFLGGFLIGQAIERCGLHRRLAHAVLRAAGAGPDRMVGGFLVASAFISMWISNTATAMMLLPVVQAATAPFRTADGGSTPAARAAMLAVAYGCSIGGMATLIGTPPNALLAAYLDRVHGIEIGFARWMMIGVPVALALLAVTWALLTRLLYRFEGSAVVAPPAAPGPWTVDERRVAAIAGLTALGWLAGPLLSHVLPGTSDTAVALAGALALFALPSAGGGALLRWQDAARIKWDVLLLFGGGLSLAEAMAGTGLADGIGAGLATALSSVPTLVAVGVVIAVVVLLSELASNTATAAAFLPIAGGLAVALGLPPVALVVTVALAASCGYMLPVATPPNAIVFGSGAVSIRDMAAAGAWLDAAAIVVLMAAAQMLLALV